MFFGETVKKWFLGGAPQTTPKPVDFRSISNRFPVDFRSISGRFPIDFRSISGRFPVDFRSISGQFLVNFRSISGRFLVNFWLISSRFPVDCRWKAANLSQNGSGSIENQHNILKIGRNFDTRRIFYEKTIFLLVGKGPKMTLDTENAIFPEIRSLYVLYLGIGLKFVIDTFSNS